MKNLNNLRLGQVFILLTIFSGWIFAQETKINQPTPNIPTNNKTVVKPRPEVPTVFSPPATPETYSPANNKDWEKDKDLESFDDIPVEKFIEVDSNVNISLCVSEGNLKINGWDRNEIRVFVNRGSGAGFRPYGKNDDGNPTRVTVLGYDPKKDKEVRQCLSGDEIELDVPSDAYLTTLNGQKRVSVTIESIAKVVKVENNAGNVQLREVRDGIGLVKTYEGNITVEDSSGPISLETTNGSIFVYNVEPTEDGDALKVKTNSGQIVLQSTVHSITEVRAITGSIRFTGEIQTDGQYVFKNTSGMIQLGIPKDSSCMIQVLSQKNKFSYTVPLSVETETLYAPSWQKVIGRMGDGEATISLTSDNGAIIIKKIN